MYVQFSSHQELTTIEQNIHGREDEVCNYNPFSVIIAKHVVLIFLSCHYIYVK